jgi:hypothetical protein
LRRDCAEGAGPAVELASPPAFEASLPPRVCPGWLVGGVGCAGVVAGFAPPIPNRPGALVVAVGAPDVAGAELPPPSPENSDGLGAVDVWVVVAPLVAGVLPDAGAAGLPMLNNELPPVFPPVAPAFANKVEAGGVEDAGAALLPPKLNEAMAGGCEEAEAAGVAPRLKPDGLLAGVEEGVALGALNNDGFGAACPCAPAVSA